MIRVAEWNAQGLTDKGVEALIMADDFDPDVIFILETHLVESDEMPSLPGGYEIFRHDRPGATKKKRGGGIIALVRKGIEVVELVVSERDSTTEWLALRVEGCDEPIWFTGIYVPSGRIDWNTGFLDRLLSTGSVVVCGDFNGRHRAIGVVDEGRNYNASGRVVADLISSGRLYLCGDDRPTHIKGRRLDLWLCSADLFGKLSGYDVGDRYNSDHHVNCVSVDVKGLET